jgi:hypothetical protein
MVLAACVKRRSYAISLGMSANHSGTPERVIRGTWLGVEGELKLVASSLDSPSFGKRRGRLAACYCNRPLHSMRAILNKAKNDKPVRIRPSTGLF